MINKLYKSILFSILLSSIFCQVQNPTIGMFVDSGNSSMFTFDYESESLTDPNGNMTAMLYGGSYLLDGKVEFSVYYQTAIATFDDLDSDFDQTMTLTGLGGKYYIKDSSLPFTPYVGAQYASLSADSDWLSDNNIELTGIGSSFCGGIYKQVSTTESISIYGFITFTSATINLTMKDNLGNSLEESDKSQPLSFGCALKFKNGIALVPSITQSDGDSSFNILFGYSM
tara:strand:+ start:70 stop:753 length:684 start_codon:yes stop_codon:yes gene_type:complete